MAVENSLKQFQSLFVRAGERPWEQVILLGRIAHLRWYVYGPDGGVYAVDLERSQSAPSACRPRGTIALMSNWPSDEDLQALAAHAACLVDGHRESTCERHESKQATSEPSCERPRSRSASPTGRDSARDSRARERSRTRSPCRKNGVRAHDAHPREQIHAISPSTSGRDLLRTHKRFAFLVEHRLAFADGGAFPLARPRLSTKMRMAAMRYPDGDVDMFAVKNGVAHGNGVRWQAGYSTTDALRLVNGKPFFEQSVDDPVRECQELGFPREQIPPKPMCTTWFWEDKCLELLLNLWYLVRDGKYITKPFWQSPLSLDGYSEAVKQPMWLDRVATKLKEGAYKDEKEFLADVRLIWSNADCYNRGKGGFHSDALECSIFARDYMNMMLPPNRHHPPRSAKIEAHYGRKTISF
eukprot:TRINITY_DN75402_c0_g1_i1.p1 TRINITY_DN75402_c0_g1~~TRINITY_DN75402_c0_g1_i1.p1  ORF type:complete len:435 (+),score=44.06 TRINITY_DN75402_c0_g1_i1:72-1307(+)